VLIGLDHLALSPGPLSTLRRFARNRAGMVVATGATDSGKTTLLYSLLLEANASGRPGRNILTVEDPVEYVLGQGISQTAINVRAGLTFTAAMKAMRRSDPDVVLCGEVRDLATAELAVETALTGHLVFLALHTQSAIGVIQRLRDIGIENHLIADVLTGVIAQRLVRRIDSRKTEEYQPDPEELHRIGLTPADGPFVRGIPTEENGGTGFHGRIPLIEILEVSPALRRLVADRGSYEELFRAAFANGGSLRDDARARVRAGLTTVEEANWALFDYPSA
jgi:type II secretory ATPase GspE/PulE/Tfp pilus assembly ATPase PilB-like protein